MPAQTTLGEYARARKLEEKAKLNLDTDELIEARKWLSSEVIDKCVSCETERVLSFSLFARRTVTRSPNRSMASSMLPLD
jgi:hypothetical protein